MQAFHASFTAVMLRFYLMMAVVIVGYWTGQYWLAFFALPIFLSCLLGVKFSFGEMKQQSQAAMKQLAHGREDISKAA